MHLFKLVACKTLQSFQSVFYAQCNFSEEKSFLSENHFCNFGALRRLTIASVSFLATCYWVNALCEADGDNLTLEAPRREAGFRVIFGSHNASHFQ